MSTSYQARVAIPAWKALSGQILVWTGVSGGVLTMIASWSTFIKATGWLHAVTEGFEQLISSLFRGVAFPAILKLSKEDTLSLSFIIFYILLIAGSLMLEENTSSMMPRLKRLVQVFVVAYLIWPCVFFLSFVLDLWTVSDRFSMLLIFLSCIALSCYFLNAVVPVDLDMLGLLVWFFMCNIVALANIAETIFGAKFIPNNSWHAASDILLTLLMIMVLFFPAVLTPRNVLKNGLKIMIIGAPIAFGIVAVTIIDISHLNLPRLPNCCVVRFPWEQPASSF